MGARLNRHGPLSSKMKKKAERQVEMEPPKPNKPNPPPWPLRQVRIGGDGRRLDSIAAGSARLRASPYFRMRALVHELRPLFVQVLQTLDMQHSVTAQEIREKLKHLMNLYKQMTAETASAEWYNNISSSRHIPGQFQNIPRPLNVESQMAQPPSYSVHGFPVMHQYKKPDPVETRGTFLVGGSTLGWNFITYPGKKSVYYGQTKKSFRVAQSKLPKEIFPASLVSSPSFENELWVSEEVNPP